MTHFRDSWPGPELWILEYIPRWEMLCTREQINEQIDDLLVWLSSSSNDFSAAARLPAQQPKSQCASCARMLNGLLGFIYYDQGIMLRYHHKDEIDNICKRFALKILDTKLQKFPDLKKIDSSDTN